MATPAYHKKTIKIQNHDVTLTWEPYIDDKTAQLVTASLPFRNWEEKMGKIKNEDPAKPELYVESVHIQAVDMFGSRVGFSKLMVTAKKWNEKERKVANVPGIMFMRGGAVGILCILKENVENGKEYAVVTLQPRIPAGEPEFCEIPAGMLDDEKHRFAGKAADEMNEETMLQIKEDELFDLTEMAFKDRYPGMYPSAGGCDEFIRLFLYRRFMNKEALETLRDARGGDGDSEIIKLKLIPIEDLWKEAPDAKALSALYLYQKYLETNKDTHPLPADPEQEQLLIEKLKLQRAV